MVASIALITSITIDRLRGIKHGEVSGLTGLSILLGPNGCGKSTVLEALLIGGAPLLGDAVGRAVRRRVETRFGLPWLFWERGAEGDIEISVANLEAFDSTTVWQSAPGEAAARTLQRGVAVGPDIQVAFEPDNTYRASRGGRPAPFLRLIESSPGAIHAPLPPLFTDADLAGGLPFVDEVLRELVEDYDGLKIQSDPDSQAVLFLIRGGRQVPVSLSGEGISALIRMLLELAICRPHGTALLEEPEAHQYPRSIRLLARGVVEAIRRGVQVVVTTHSLELVQNLLHFAGEAAVLASTSVHLLRLRDNVLTATRLDGESARFQVEEMEADLR